MTRQFTFPVVHETPRPPQDVPPAPPDTRPQAISQRTLVAASLLAHRVRGDRRSA